MTIDDPAAPAAAAEQAKTPARYLEVARELGRQIAEGAFSNGAALPAELRLAKQFGVSRDTVRKALVRLERRGVVVARYGVGWFVQSSLHTQQFTELRSFAQWATNRGLHPGGQVIDQWRAQASADEARALRIALGEEVLRVTRLRTLDDEPVMLERTTYAPWVMNVVESLPADLPSVVAALEQAGIAMVFGQQRIDAVPASSNDAQLLRVRRSSPLLRVSRETYNREGRAIEHGEDRYLPGTIRFEVDSAATSAAPGPDLL